MTYPDDTTRTIPSPSEPHHTPVGLTEQTAQLPHTPVPPPPGSAFVKPVERPRRRIGELTTVALLSALLASGGTYAVTQATDGSTPTATTTTQTTSADGTVTSPVVQGAAGEVDWAAVAKAVSPSVVSIEVQTQQGAGAGSGVVFDAKGDILTNNHVVEGATAKGAITVTLADGRTYAATIVGTDPSTDLAVIRLESGPDDLTPITLGDSDSVTVGAPVMAVGNPLGLSGTVTTGIISALDRPVTTGDTGSNSPFGEGPTTEPVVTNAIQTSAAINPGNSGGALVDSAGRLIGINSSIAQLGSTSSQSGNIGIGFAIPVKEAQAIATQLIAKGSADHAFLGVSTRDTTTTDGSSKRAGAGIAAVTDGTPAAKAGLKVGDVVIAVDGQRVDSSTALIAQVRERTVGDQVTLTIIRDGKRQDVQVTLAVKPSTNG
jgi:putative serine protease PepD